MCPAPGGCSINEWLGNYNHGQAHRSRPGPEQDTGTGLEGSFDFRRPPWRELPQVRGHHNLRSQLCKKPLVPPGGASHPAAQTTTSSLHKDLKADASLLFSAYAQGARTAPGTGEVLTNISGSGRKSLQACVLLCLEHVRTPTPHPHPPERLFLITLPDLSLWQVSHTSVCVTILPGAEVLKEGQ